MTTKETLSEDERRVLKVLLLKPLPIEEVVSAMAPTPEHVVRSTLYQLDKKQLVVSQPAVGGGCRSCACEVKYAWRLTYAGRQATMVEAT